MAVKTLEDFNNDYWAYVAYLESAQYANDAGWNVVADEKGNIYTPTDGDWTKGHGHQNVHNGYDRKPESDKSKGRKWENRWLKLIDKLELTQEELQFLCLVYVYQNDNSNIKTKNKILLKK